MPRFDGSANLVPFNEMPVEKQRMIRSMGGKASQAKQKRRKTQAEIIRQIMDLKLTPEEGAEKLEQLGLDPTWATDANVAVMQKARKGDVESLRYLRDTIGEKPRDGLEIGNLDDKPLASVDLSQMSDDQLKAMIAAREALQTPETE